MGVISTLYLASIVLFFYFNHGLSYTYFSIREKVLMDRSHISLKAAVTSPRVQRIKDISLEREIIKVRLIYIYI